MCKVREKLYKDKMDLKRIARVVVFCASLLISAHPLFAAYYGYSQWYDVNKNGADDSNLCWAAAASNILAWGGWGTPEYNTNSAIFQNFKDHWTNQGSLMDIAWRWWLNGEYPPGYPYGDDWARVDKEGGGNYWPEKDFDAYYHENWNSAQAMSAIDNYLHDGYGVTAAIYQPSGGHALSVWGYKFNGNNDYLGIYVTDSDDSLERRVYYPVSLRDQRWYLGGNYFGWYIGGVEALAVTPEPLSFFLFLAGAVPLVLFRLKRKEQAV